MLAKGKYKARGLSAEMGKSDQKGTPYVKVQFRVAGGSDDGATISWNGYYTELTEDRTLESLRACGCTFPNGDATNFDGIDRNEVELVVEHEEYTNQQGEEKTIAKVAWVNGGSFGIKEENKMTDAERKQFALRMKGKVLADTKPASPNQSAARPANSAQRPAQQQRPAQRPNGAGRAAPPDDFNYGSEDDIPF
jgi:hypothetical protein